MPLESLESLMSYHMLAVNSDQIYIHIYPYANIYIFIYLSIYLFIYLFSVFIHTYLYITELYMYKCMNPQSSWGTFYPS